MPFPGSDQRIDLQNLLSSEGWGAHSFNGPFDNPLSNRTRYFRDQFDRNLSRIGEAGKKFPSNQIKGVGILAQDAGAAGGDGAAAAAR